MYLNIVIVGWIDSFLKGQITNLTLFALIDKTFTCDQDLDSVYRSVDSSPLVMNVDVDRVKPSVVRGDTQKSDASSRCVRYMLYCSRVREEMPIDLVAKHRSCRRCNQKQNKSNDYNN